MSDQAPSIYHITHWKAGSQWLRAVFLELCPERLAELTDEESLCRGTTPPKPGMIYSPIYCQRKRFERELWSTCPHRKFVVLRDLRDTLVSWYFSLVKTHGPNSYIDAVRPVLQAMDHESGIYTLLSTEPYASDFYRMTLIHQTWLEGLDQDELETGAASRADGTLVLRFEDLAANPKPMMGRILKTCGLEIDEPALDRALDACSFEKMRGSGEADDQGITAFAGGVVRGAHYRSGKKGDWVNHFSDRIKAAFDVKYGELLVAGGYEA
jgi:Sulfotransferase domain